MVSFLWRVARFSLRVKDPRILVIGDSHSAFLSGTRLRLLDKFEDFYSFWLGPRLLYSIGTNGIRVSKIRILALKLLRFEYGVYIFGEIDVRVHLGSRIFSQSDWDSWISLSLTELERFSNEIGLKHVLIICGPPPTDFGAINRDFPRNGSIESRVKAFEILNYRVQCLATGKFARVKYLYPWQQLQSVDGTLHRDYTDDGCHLNSRGSQIMRAILRDELVSRS